MIGKFGVCALLLAALSGCGDEQSSGILYYDQPGIPAFESYVRAVPPSKFGFVHWAIFDEFGAWEGGESSIRAPLTTSRGLEAFRSGLEQFKDGGYFETVGVIAPSDAPMRAMMNAVQLIFEVKGFTRFYFRGRAASEPEHVFFLLAWTDPQSQAGPSAMPLSFEWNDGAVEVQLEEGPLLSPEEARREVALRLTDYGSQPAVRLSVEPEVPSGVVLEILSAASLDGSLSIVNGDAVN